MFFRKRRKIKKLAQYVVNNQIEIQSLKLKLAAHTDSSQIVTMGAHFQVTDDEVSKCNFSPNQLTHYVKHHLIELLGEQLILNNTIEFKSQREICNFSEITYYTAKIKCIKNKNEEDSLHDF